MHEVSRGLIRLAIIPRLLSQITASFAAEHDLSLGHCRFDFQCQPIRQVGPSRLSPEHMGHCVSCEGAETDPHQAESISHAKGLQKNPKQPLHGRSYLARAPKDLCQHRPRVGKSGLGMISGHEKSHTCGCMLNIEPTVQRQTLAQPTVCHAESDTCSSSVTLLPALCLRSCCWPCMGPWSFIGPRL